MEKELKPTNNHKRIIKTKLEEPIKDIGHSVTFNNKQYDFKQEIIIPSHSEVHASAVDVNGLLVEMIYKDGRLVNVIEH